MKVIILTILIASAFASSDLLSQFHQWQIKYNKTYTSEQETSIRFTNFRQSVIRSNHRNAFQTGNAVFGLTKFSDLSPEEFQDLYLRYKPSGDTSGASISPVSDVSDTIISLPDSFDWRDQNAVSYVKDQGQCGSCWAFSAVENIESMYFLGGHELIDLSPQQIVDCDTVDLACQGGQPDTAYQYVVNATGIESDDAYPYYSGVTGENGPCTFDPSKISASIKGYEYALPPCYDACDHQSESLLQQQLVNIGPLSICVDADPWQDYQEGVLSDFCSHAYSDINHCVQLVGYDTSGEFWIVRNSWATDWGMEGYIYLATGENQCGLADWVTFAIV